MNIKIDKKGVTLIEILVTLAIAGIVMAGIYEIYLSVQKHGQAQDEIAEMQQNIRVATDQIIKELRTAGYNPAPIVGIVGSACITPDSPGCSTRTLTASYPSNAVTIRGDFDGDGVYEEVTYKVNASSELVRCYKVSTDPNPCQDEVFVPNITSVVFSFYDNINNVPVAINTDTATSSVRRVSVTIQGRTKARSTLSALWAPLGYKTASLTSDAILRNFGSSASDTVPPSCPTNIAVVATGNCGELQVTWSWTDTKNEGDLAGFIVYYQAANGLDTGTLTVSDPSARSAFLQKRQNSVSYSIDVLAYDRYFNKNTTCASPMQTAMPNSSLGAPSPPDGFKATPGNNQVTLTWNPIDTSIANNRDVKGYRLYRETTADFIPSSTNMIACERTKSDETPACTNNLLSTPDAETGWSSVTSFTDTTAVNCTTYYYIIRSIDQCPVVSSNSTVVSATPPDNNKKPNTPIITSLVAGDDTSSIIVNWTLTYDQSDTTHSPPDIFRVYYKPSTSPTWTQWGADIPIDIANPSTLSGSATLNMLLTNTSYDIKISAYDSVAMCRNESDVTASNTGIISTAACAPRISWGTRGGHFVFPGITTTGTALANNSKVGTEPDTVTNSRFLTWIVDPLDCTPDSSNYDRQGFDYNNPPAYTTVSPNARVEFFINSSGSVTDIGADTAYNDTTITQHVDMAPRASDNYYHWPTYPLNPAHIDTSRLCNGLKDFKIRAVDGETYTAENSIILEIKNGGIVQNSSQAAITNITTPDDFHNQVTFGLRNSSTVKDLKITKMKLSWTNTFVNLKKIEVLDSTGLLIGLFEDTVAPIDTVSGTEVTLTTIPNISIGSTATVKVTFTKSDGSVPSTTDMRGKTLTLDSITFQDNTDSSFVCSATGLASLATSTEPIIGTVTQDQPSQGTSARTTTGLLVAANSSVGISLPVTDSSATVSSVTIQYKVDTSGSSTAPTRPSSLTDFGNYPNLVSMIFDTATSLWKGTIPSNNNARIWYFIEAVDATGNFDISPDTGAYTYSQCGTTPPSLVFNSPPTPADVSNVNNVVTIEVTVSSNVGISSVVLFTDPASSALIIPATAMVEVSPGIWRGSYNATAGNLHHVLKVTATDKCGNQQTISRTYN